MSTFAKEKGETGQCRTSPPDSRTTMAFQIKLVLNFKNASDAYASMKVKRERSLWSFSKAHCSDGAYPHVVEFIGSSHYHTIVDIIDVASLSDFCKEDDFFWFFDICAN